MVRGGYWQFWPSPALAAGVGSRRGAHGWVIHLCDCVSPSAVLAHVFGVLADDEVYTDAHFNRGALVNSGS